MEEDKAVTCPTSDQESATKDLFKTPEKKKKLRRRIDGSPVLPPDPRPPKKIYMIRHGQSLGQVAKQNGMDRRKDQRLTDCDLTKKGQAQAGDISTHFTEDALHEIQLVISSPLTRALHTALLGFPSKDILVAYDLRELGSKVPENLPRSMKEVCKTLSPAIQSRASDLSLDLQTLQPHDWPRDFAPLVTKKDRIRKVLQWIYREREESTLAIVCHFNVIRSAIVDGETMKPANATPICCKLFASGDLVLESQ